jgi:hypothetical protein
VPLGGLCWLVSLASRWGDVKHLHRMVLAWPTRWKQCVLGRLVGDKMIAFLVDGGLLQLAVLYVFVPQTLLWGFCACLHLAQTGRRMARLLLSISVSVAHHCL